MATQPTNLSVPSESPRDLKFNAGKIDEFVTSLVNNYVDRFGNEHYTIEGLRWLAQQAIAQYGYITLDSFQAGANITLPNQVLRDTNNGEYYRWDGAFPKNVPAGSTPQNTGGVGKGGWVSVGDASLRANLAAPGGVDLVADAVDKRGDVMSGGLRISTTYGNLIVGDQPLPVEDSTRDAINVARKIDNSPTNCHGFADKTWINQASDYGGYGAFDSTVLVSGSNTHNHAYSFQDRINYAGSGVLQNMEGLYSSPTITGSGTVESRMGVFINNAAVTNGGTLLQQNGIFIEDLFSATTNVGIHVRQTQGLGYYAPNFGKMWQNGVAGFGIDPSQLATAINWRGGATGSFYGFLTTDANGTYLGTTGDTGLKFVSGNEVRLQIKPAAVSQRALTPGNDNSTPLGDIVNRWSTVFAGTGSINTSDGREKSQPVTASELSKTMANDEDAILDAWGDVSIIAFQWLNSIKEKGQNEARWHFGVIAQQVKEVFESKGIDGTRFGLLCYDEWEDQYEIVPEEVKQHPDEYSAEPDESGRRAIIKEAWTEVVKPEGRLLVTPAGNRWGIRADQCLWLEAAYQRRERQKLEARITNLENLFSSK
ncbi:tail fiber/spike domain-containing protein [Cronobacter sakazakii]|uniref:tail fiber/spike domain-containing protein n=1 Tax=Cronobacter sakazakii TaxID=28141 RepID=UPI002ACEBD21|nr:tail fiber domain-containing protein [Cronobacter sakazakii]MDZ7554444.1 tail fiber domain-containing protein [Cronobacter sakazakii]